MPVVSVITATLLLGERLTGLALTGMALIILGLVISEGRLPLRRKKSLTAAGPRPEIPPCPGTAKSPAPS